MARDLVKNNLLNNKPLITLFYLDVGQLEYFSSEKIIPLHAHWKYSIHPSPDAFLNFLKKIPSEEFYILSAKGLDAKNLESYLGHKTVDLEKFLKKNNLQVDMIKDYKYTSFNLSYQLYRIRRVQI
jgi:hypothetical protein